MQFVDEIERALGVGRSLHVDADKAGRVHGCGLGDQPADDFPRQCFIHIKSHVSELEADIGVEMVGGDGVENLLIELRAVAGLVRIGDVLAKVVDAHAHADAVDGLRSADGVGNLGSGNEASGDAAAQR